MQPDPTPTGVHCIAVLVGNTTINAASAHGHEIRDHLRFPAGEIASAVDGIASLGDSPVVIATVNRKASNALVAALIDDDRITAEIHELGRDLPVSIDSSIPESAGTGQDRLLAAAGAYTLLGQACVVVDAGTALTIDFVDGEGVFQGGAILPGAAMSLRALHEGAPALPMLTVGRPDDTEPFGKNTEQAMRNGSIYGVQGAVRLLTERYAERYGAYPQVIATGGDAAMLFEGDELIDRIVPELPLIGIAVAYQAALTGDESTELSR